MGTEDGDGLAMGVDSQGAPIHHWGSEEVGGLPGLHGVEAGYDPAADPAGTPLADVDIPPAHDTDASTGWFGEAAHAAYHELTTPPDPNGQPQPSPDTEEADRERAAGEESYKEATGTHMVNAPEQHF